MTSESVRTPPVDPDGGRAGALGRLLPERGPQRTLSAAVLINTVGTGMYSASSALYFTRSVGLPAPLVGLGLSIAALAGLLVAIPAGQLADLWGPGRMWATTLFVEAGTMASFTLVHSFATFVLVACLGQLAGGGSAAARTPVIRRLGGADPARFRAYLRSVTNLGISVGALAAGGALQFGTRPAYLMLILGNAASFAGCAAAVLTLPKLPPLGRPAGAGRWQALKDRPYVAITAVNGVISLHYPVLTFALPLWIVSDTKAPRFLVAGALLTNTALVTIFQVRASRRVDTPGRAARAMRASALALLASFALIVILPALPALAAALTLVGAVAVYTLGELRQAAASFELSFGLAPPHAQGLYGGVFGMGQELAIAAGPSLLAVVCLGGKTAGWLALGSVMVSAGMLTPAIVRWAERTRTTFHVDTPTAG